MKVLVRLEDTLVWSRLIHEGLGLDSAIERERQESSSPDFDEILGVR